MCKVPESKRFYFYDTQGRNGWFVNWLNKRRKNMQVNQNQFFIKKSRKSKVAAEKKVSALTNKQQLDQSDHQNKPRLNWIGNWTATGCAREKCVWKYVLNCKTIRNYFLRAQGWSMLLCEHYSWNYWQNIGLYQCKLVLGERGAMEFFKSLEVPKEDGKLLNILLVSEVFYSFDILLQCLVNGVP